MRTMTRNQTKVWIVPKATMTDVVDENNHYTGEKIPTYGTVIETFLSMYPSDGSINSQTFGIEKSYDMVAVSHGVDLDEKDLIFLSQPTIDYDKTYDYIIDKKMSSVNVIKYGLMKRV